MNLSIQVVDCAFGIAAAGVQVGLSRRVSQDWVLVAEGYTDSNGSLRGWHDGALSAGTYRLEADMDRYYADLGIVPFLPRAVVEFRVTDVNADLIIPLLITGNSQLAYRLLDETPPTDAGL
jgi:5-hydroxyisourate hydrolase